MTIEIMTRGLTEMDILQGTRNGILAEIRNFKNEDNTQKINLPKDYIGFIARFENFANTLEQMGVILYGENFHGINNIDAILSDFQKHSYGLLANGSSDSQAFKFAEKLIEEKFDVKDFIRECLDCGIDVSSAIEMSTIMRLVNISKAIGKNVAESV